MFLTRAVLKNYKSIAACDAALGPLVFLAGPNGSGKSNFLDALRFCADALRTSLDHALRERGGIGEVRRRSGGHPNHFGIRLEFALPDGSSGHYGFEVGSRTHARYEIEREECVVGTEEFVVERGAGRLYLPARPTFRPLYDALCGMAFYDFNPERLRDLQPPDAGPRLAREGSNLASVIGRLSCEDKQRVEQHLARIVPGLQGVDARSCGPRETLEFRQGPWRFPAASMSGGTLRALAVLVALCQTADAPLVGIEEPELALHPAAAGILREALRQASEKTQVLATSFSPDLLDDEAGSILAVYTQDGNTQIEPVGEKTRAVLREHLSTGGEWPEDDAGQMKLFNQPGLAEGGGIEPAPRDPNTQDPTPNTL